MKHRYSFKAGLFEPRRSVTVVAVDEQDAREKATALLDKRFEKQGKEPPVAWDLELVSME